MAPSAAVEAGGAHNAAGCRLGQVLLAALFAAACCAAFAGYLESSPPAAPASPRASIDSRLALGGFASQQPHGNVAASTVGATAAQAPEAGDAAPPREWLATTAGGVEVDVRPTVAGRVARRAAAEGGMVQQGDVLFEIDPRPFQERLAQARSELTRARDLDSIESLRAAVDQASADLAATRVRSPLTGEARLLQARVGDLVNPTSVLATISGIDTIRVRFRLSEQDYLRYLGGLRPDAPAPQRFAALELELGPGATHPLPGYLAGTGRQVDLATRTIDAEGLFPNPGHLLRPGRQARVRERG